MADITCTQTSHSSNNDGEKPFIISFFLFFLKLIIQKKVQIVKCPKKEQSKKERTTRVHKKNEKKNFFLNFFFQIWYEKKRGRSWQLSKTQKKKKKLNGSFSTYYINKQLKKRVINLKERWKKIFIWLFFLSQGMNDIRSYFISYDLMSKIHNYEKVGIYFIPKAVIKCNQQRLKNDKGKQ